MKAVDTFRTRLRDMLFGRTSIKVVKLDSESDDVIPYFLIGSFRSGTTLFRYLLDSHSQICCPPETKFQVHLSQMYQSKSTISAFADMGFDNVFIKDEIKKFTNNIYNTHMQAAGKQLIIDKTPDYVRILDYLDWLYDGKTRYVCIFRNGLDVAHSMNETHIEPIESDKSINSAFEYWEYDTKTMLEWMNKYPERCHKVIYEQLCDDTEATLKGVMSFLDLEFESEQLEWYTHKHDRGAEDIKARRQRRINKSVHNYLDWPEETINELKSRSASLHTAIGYDANSLELN